MLSEGTENLPSEALDDFFDFHGSEVEVISGYERQGLSLLTTKKHFIKVLPVFRSLFTEAVFPEKNLKKRKSQKKLSISIQNEQTSSRANQLVRSGFFGKQHPFGFQATETDVDAIGRDQLISCYRTEFLTQPHLFVTGQLSEAELTLLEKHFEDLPLISGKNTESPPLSPTVGRQTETKASALQSSIRIGKWMIPLNHPDYLPLSLFNTILGGYFGSRLIRNIREEKGYTYGINSLLGNLNGNAYWMVTAEVKGGYGDEVIREVYKEIQRLTDEPISGEELEKIKNYLAGNLLANFSSPFDLMSHFQLVYFEGLDFSFYARKLAFIKNFDGSQLREIGEKYFSPKSMQEVIVGQL